MSIEEASYSALGGSSPQSFPLPGEGEAPVSVLAPGSDHHAVVLQYLKCRLKASEDEMGKFYDRWRINEKRVQAYINLPDYEKMLKEMNDKGAPAKVVSITVPYSWATISTIVTYLVQVFTGQKPMFPVASNSSEGVQSAEMMELVLQYNADHVRLIKHLFQLFNDGELYGLGVLRTQWKNEKAWRTQSGKKPVTFLGIQVPGMSEPTKEKVLKTIFQGTGVMSIDPFMFFPDPRVPIHEVNTRGEFVFWRTFEGIHALKRAQADGLVAWVDQIKVGQDAQRSGNQSDRNLMSRGTSQPGARERTRVGDLKDFVQLDQGTVEIVPSELSLGSGEAPEKWIFTIANGTQIIQAEPFDADHGKHPVVVSEPYTMGYGFGSAGISDYIGPLQETMSWFLNSHIHNVRATQNNMFVVDPSMVEMSDIRNPEPGKLIRLKRAAYGRDVRMAVTQFQVQDVTRSNVNDMQVFSRIADSLSAITDNIRGLQDSGGRKTATEIRTSSEAAASRLASHARLISAQTIVDLTEQMSLNLQQYLDDEFYLQVVGSEGRQVPLKVSPEALVGDFYYPVNDGTLPYDKGALLDVWKEIFMGIAADPQLRQEYNLSNIFSFMAKLGGAKNIESFKLQVAPPGGQLPSQVQAGNMVPMPQMGAASGFQL